MARRARSLQQLLDEVNTRFPLRDTGSDGWIGDAAHRSRPSDHNPNSAGVVQAQDFDEHTHDQNQTVGQALWDFLLTSRDPRIKYVIYEGDMFSSYPAHGHPPFTVRNYTGSNQHLTHLHLSVVDDPALHDDPSPWGFTEGDDIMREGDSGPQVAQWQHTVNRALVLTGTAFDGGGKQYEHGKMLRSDGDFGPKTKRASEVAINACQDVVGHPFYGDASAVTPVTQAFVVSTIHLLRDNHQESVGSHSHGDDYADKGHTHGTHSHKPAEVA